jgi:hypothetical protein
MLNWLETTSYAEWAGQSWGWALALTIHAFGTATVVGLTFIIGLRLFGLFGTIPYTSMNKLVPFIWFAAACRSSAASRCGLQNQGNIWQTACSRLRSRFLSSPWS